VAEDAELVHIDESRLEAVAHVLQSAPSVPTEPMSVEFAFTFNAVNFGSGWHPHLAKIPGCSGSVTIMHRLRERFEMDGALTAHELSALTPVDCAKVFGQALMPPVDDLMSLFARSLNDLGDPLHYDGSFHALLESAGGSATSLVELLLQMPMYRDVATYDGVAVPFLKRAQLTASDIGGLSELDRLTVFADNLVPHVMRVEGVLQLDEGLAAAIDRGRLLEPGSAGEVELRACAVEAGERMVAVLGGSLAPREIDNRLWRWGQEPRFKAVSRPRVRTPYY
jgi:hypothetical protein